MAVLLLYAAGINGQWRLGPDTATYATIGHSIYEDRGYTHPIEHADWASPGLPYLLALNFHLFGAQTMWPAVVLMWLMGLGTLATSYCLIRLHANRGTAVVVTCLLGITVTFYRHTLEVLTDIPFMWGLMLFLLGHERVQRGMGLSAASWLLIATGLLLMAVFRFVVLVVAAAIVLTCLIAAIRRRRIGPALAGLLVLICLAVVRLVDPRNQGDWNLLLKESQTVDKLLYELPQTLMHAVTVNLPQILFEIGPEALFGNKLGLDAMGGLVTIVAFAFGLSLARKRLIWGILVGLFLVQWLLFLPAVRYVLPILPLLAYGWWRAARCALAVVPGRWGVILAVGMIILWAGMNLPRTIGVVATQRSTPFAQHYENGRYMAIPRLGRELHSATEADAWIFSSVKWWSSPLCFYTGRKVVSSDKVHLMEHGPIYVVEALDDKPWRPAEIRNWQLGPPIMPMIERGTAAPLVVRRVQAAKVGATGDRSEVASPKLPL